jgi:hypothetical protein
MNRKTVVHKAAVISVDGTTKEYDTRPSLREAQAIVDGYIEFVHIPKSSYTLVVNEEGRVINLPLNDGATKRFGFKLYGNVIVLEGWKTVG